MRQFATVGSTVVDPADGTFKITSVDTGDRTVAFTEVADKSDKTVTVPETVTSNGA